MWRNLLAPGTRVVELCSAFALIFGALAYWANILILPSTITQPSIVLAMTLGVGGLLQFYTLLKYPGLEYLRVVLSWIIGLFWIWVGLVDLGLHADISDLAAIGIGLGNLYGFFINFNLVKVAWNH